MSTSPVASAGSACSGSASISSQRSFGAVSTSASIAGSDDPQRDGLEGRDPHAAGDGPRRGGEVGLRAGGALEQRLGVLDQHAGGIGQADAAAGALEQAHAGLSFEQRELLGDRARRELERVGDRGDRAALAELLQQPQASEFEHALAMLLLRR